MCKKTNFSSKFLTAGPHWSQKISCLLRSTQCCQSSDGSVVQAIASLAGGGAEQLLNGLCGKTGFYQLSQCFVLKHNVLSYHLWVLVLQGIRFVLCFLQCIIPPCQENQEDLEVQEDQGNLAVHQDQGNQEDHRDQGDPSPQHTLKMRGEEVESGCFISFSLVLTEN